MPLDFSPSVWYSIGIAMRFPLLKPGQAMAGLLFERPAHGHGLRAPARADRRTKKLARRLRPGDIAIIDHADLDGPAAEALVACRVAAVINASPSISGRYPNRGPEVLAAAGIPLIDGAGPAILDSIHDGDLLDLHDDGTIYRDGTCIGQGQPMTMARLAEEIAHARGHLDTELHAFVLNTLSYVEQERGLLFEAAALPEFRSDVRDRHVVVVVRGEGARQDLATIKGYIRDRRPILIGVDGGADLLREQGLRPDVIFGDMDSVSDDALRGSAQLIVHAYADGRCPGKDRLDRLGLSYEMLPGRGTSEDVVLMATYEKGAELIIAVGTHFNLVDFLDKARSGMSSTFLVRLRIGSRLVDAKGVNRLYHVPYPIASFTVMFLTAVAAAVVIVLNSHDVQALLQFLLIEIERLLHFR